MRQWMTVVRIRLHSPQVQLIGVDTFLMHSLDVIGLLRFGDTLLARQFTSRLAQAFADVDVASVPSLGVGICFATAHASSIFAELGTHNASLSLLNTFGCAFGTVHDAARTFFGALAAGISN